MTDGFTWAPATEPPSEACQPSMGTPTHEELEALLQEQDGAGLEPTMEEGPSAALEFLLDLEYSPMVEAGLGEKPLTLSTRVDAEGSLFPPQTRIHPPNWCRRPQAASMGGIEWDSTEKRKAAHFMRTRSPR